MSTASDNITLTEEQPQQNPFVPAPGQPEVKLTDIDVTNENMALNLIVSFLNVAQRRGAFNLEESAKIWECVQKFVQVNNA